MRYIKLLIDFLNSLRKVWPILFVIIGWVISEILWMLDIGRTPVTFSLPASMVVGIGALTLYPIAKLVQWAMLVHWRWLSRN